MGTEVERVNGADNTGQPIATNFAAGTSPAPGGRYRPVLKTLKFELEGIEFTMTFEAMLDRDGEGDPPVNPPIG